MFVSPLPPPGSLVNDENFPLKMCSSETIFLLLPSVQRSVSMYSVNFHQLSLLHPSLGLYFRDAPLWVVRLQAYNLHCPLPHLETLVDDENFSSNMCSSETICLLFFSVQSPFYLTTMIFTQASIGFNYWVCLSDCFWQDGLCYQQGFLRFMALIGCPRRFLMWNCMSTPLDCYFGAIMLLSAGNLWVWC